MATDFSPFLFALSFSIYVAISQTADFSLLDISSKEMKLQHPDNSMLCLLGFSDKNFGWDSEEHAMPAVPQQAPLKSEIEDNAKHSPFENPMLFRSLQRVYKARLSTNTSSLVL